MNDKEKEVIILTEYNKMSKKINQAINKSLKALKRFRKMNSVEKKEALKKMVVMM